MRASLQPIRILIIDDHTILRRGLRMMLDQQSDLQVVGEAGTGMAAMFGVQAMINMAVNLGVFPSKGMTLPFISYGGSSILALSVTCGLILALTKRNPYLDRSLYMVKG